MDPALHTMMENLRKNTGKSLDEWAQLVREQALDKHGQMMAYLKGTHGLTHGFANLVAHAARSTPSVNQSDENLLIDNQYKGKEHMRPLYDLLLGQITRFGADITIAPKNTYVSLRRKKQFATLGPATKTRFDIGLNIRGLEAIGPLHTEKPGAMCSHKISIGTQDDVTTEIMEWIKMAYEQAG
ncbi:MAG: DUF4287 domain-containing protein [Bacteroidetes bacterium]|nr:DUF4287 domain-containing protein [Bacteroidota bacterium]